MSELDEYLCNLFDIYFQNIILSKDELICFEYDYNLLSRAPLKIAYNTSRCGTSDPKVLAKTAPYILGKTSTYPRLILLMEIISPTQIIEIGHDGIKSTIMEPLAYRSALMRLTTPNGNQVLARLVGINSYYFHLLLLKNTTPMKMKERIRNEALEALPGSVCLNEKSSVSLKMSERDGITSMMPRLLHHFHEYGNFFNNKRNIN